MTWLIRQTKTFLGPPWNAIRGYLNVSELIKAIILGFAAGGGVLGVLAALQEALGSIVVDPSMAATIGAIVAAIVDLVRRLPQGKKSPYP